MSRVSILAVFALAALGVFSHAGEPPPPHPGTITYVDGRTQQVIEVEKVADVPEAMRFAPTAEGLVPVVKVVLLKSGERSEIHEYGPSGELLRSTIGGQK